MKRYQLVKPFLSDKIYESSSLQKAASKCYKEVKLNQVAGASTFTIRNVDTNEMTIWKIHNPYYGEKTDKNKLQKYIQSGGEQTLQPANKDNEKIISLQNSVESLTTRIGILENKLSTYNVAESGISNANNLSIGTQKSGTCTIM